jgi:hypothetical protein
MTAHASSRGNNLRLQLSDEIADLASRLFVRCLRRARLGKLLKPRIIPERIEHRIEPVQRRSERGHSSAPADDIESSFCKAATAGSSSPMRAATRAKNVERARTGQHVFLNWICGHRTFRQGQGGDLIAQTQYSSTQGLQSAGSLLAVL